jgi:hypothetical protein
MSARRDRAYASAAIFLTAMAPGCTRPQATTAEPIVPVAAASGAPSATTALALAPIAPERFCTTSGTVHPIGPRSMKVDTGGMRGVVADDAGSLAEVRFTVRGPSKKTSPLANGEIRRQIGLKLRGQDTCNVIYVMWHFEPVPGLGVSVKRNPDQSVHAQCGDRGYIDLRPMRGAPTLPPVRAGERHTLRAQLEGMRLRVHADGAVAWEGPLPPEALELTGAAGVRSDNAEVDFELAVPGGAARAGSCAGVVRD